MCGLKEWAQEIQSKYGEILVGGNHDFAMHYNAMEFDGSELESVYFGFYNPLLCRYEVVSIYENIHKGIAVEIEKVHCRNSSVHRKVFSNLRDAKNAVIRWLEFSSAGITKEESKQREIDRQEIYEFADRLQDMMDDYQIKYGSRMTIELISDCYVKQYLSKVRQAEVR